MKTTLDIQSDPDIPKESEAAQFALRLAYDLREADKSGKFKMWRPINDAEFEFDISIRKGKATVKARPTGRSAKRARYYVQVGNKWVGSPTNKLTDNPNFAATFKSPGVAEIHAHDWNGKVVIEAKFEDHRISDIDLGACFDADE